MMANEVKRRHGGEGWGGSQSTAPPQANTQPDLVNALRIEGWTDEHLAMLLSLQCAQVRTFVFNYVNSLVKK